MNIQCPLNIFNDFDISCASTSQWTGTTQKKTRKNDLQQIECDIDILIKPIFHNL